MNNDLISRSALLAEYCEGCNALAKKMCDQDICAVAMMINDAPAVDAVEVVRCVECEFFEIDDGDSLGVCKCGALAVSYKGEILPDRDFFCSYGERKTDG